MPTDRSDSAEWTSQPGIRIPPATGLAGAAVLIGVALVGFITQWISVLLWVPPSRVTTVWLPGGFFLALTILTRPRRWPVLLIAATIGQAILFLWMRTVPSDVVAYVVILEIVHTAGLAYVLRLVLKRPLILDTLQQFLSYLLVVVLGGAVNASIIFLLATLAMHFRPATFLLWRTFGLATVLGYLTMTPTVVLLMRAGPSWRAASLKRRLEAIVLGALLLLASGLLFMRGADRLVIWPVFAATLPPLLLWAAMRFGPLGASAALLLVAVSSTFGTVRELGPFTGQSPARNTLSLQLFILGIGVPLLGLSVLAGERNRTWSALRSTHRRLRRLNRDLISAREEEASRIARELHDDVGQRLALISLGLSRLGHKNPETDSGEILDVTQLQEQASEVGRSLRELSHRLHPAALDHVGLVGALQLNCEEVRRATGLAIQVATEGDVSAIGGKLGLCLFRVTQEALNNVIRHSGAKTVTVALRKDDSRLVLDIGDDGRGFTPGAREQKDGLGLLTIRERVRAVGGTLTIESGPGAGTTVRVTVPLGEKRDG